MKKVRIVLWSAVVVAAAVSATLWMTERGQGPTTARVDPEAESFAANDSTMKLAVQSVLANITEK